MLYGILKSSTNTGLDGELAAIFSTPLQVKSNKPVFVSDTLSLKRYASGPGSQRWEIEARIVPTVQSTDYMVHNIVNGHATAMYVRMPQPVTKAIQSISADSVVSTSGSSAGTSSINSATPLLAGEFIRIGGADTKVYMVTANSIGLATSIFPQLIKNVTVGMTIYRGGNVTMKAYYDTDTISGMMYSDGILQDPGSVKLVEAL